MLWVRVTSRAHCLSCSTAPMRGWGSLNDLCLDPNVCVYGEESSLEWAEQIPIAMHPSSTMKRLRRSLIQRLRTLVLLLSALLWLLVGEYGVFQLYSLRWQWPSAESVLSTNASCLNKNGPPYCYSGFQDAYFFPVPMLNDSSTLLRPPKAELKMLILSDLHIMCTYK